MGSGLQASAIDYAVREVCRSIDQTGLNRLSWAAASEEELWRELVSCILGSRVRYEIAELAVKRLDDTGLLSLLRRHASPQTLESEIGRVLWNENCSGTGHHATARYPFARLRSAQVCRAASSVYAENKSIGALLKRERDAAILRRLLVDVVPGFGPKQASLFLRNIGYTTTMAVLDTHVLYYMDLLGLYKNRVKSIASIEKYEYLERMFLDYSETIGFAPDSLDIAVWIVVRVAKKEYRTWR